MNKKEFEKGLKQKLLFKDFSKFVIMFYKLERNLYLFFKPNIKIKELEV